MPVSIERFVECLSKTGILPEVDAATLVKDLPPERRRADADELARDFVRQGKLTRYQAAAIYQDKADGLVLGNYLILDKLGSGGMGQVYRARHRRMDRVVALKVLAKKALSSPDAVARFHREGRAAAKLTHPNIVSAFDADEANGVNFLVMEYVEGSDLATVVKRDGPLTPQRAVDCMLQTAHGLEHAHAAGVIHRDIKPSNLFLDHHGTVKILDMGLARVSDALSDPSAAAPGGDLTQSGSIMGTVDFMPPEQAMDSRHADARSDIYSLGCTLYYLLCGRPPYGGDTLMKRLTAHQQSAIPSLQTARPDVPAALDAVFQRMLAKQPGARYQTTRELIVALEASLTSPSAAVQGVRPVLVQAVAMATAQKTIGLSDIVGATSIVPPSGGAKRTKKTNSRGWLIPAAAAIGVAAVVGVLLFATRSGKEPTVVATRAKPPAAPVPINRPLAASETKPPTAPPAVADAERRAAEWTLKVGGKLSIMPTGGPAPVEISSAAQLPAGPFKVRSIELEGRTGADDQSLVNLEGLQGIEMLNLYLPALTDDGVRHLRGLTSLQRLRFASAALGDPSLVEFANLANLRSLALTKCRITDAGLSHLTGLRRLITIDVVGSPIGDAGIERIRGMKHLAVLNLGDTKVTDAGLAYVAELTNLNYLNLFNLPITDRGLAQLAPLTHLRQFSLDGTRITDVSVALLAGFAELTELHIKSTALTEAGANRLRAELRNCKIDWNSASQIAAAPGAALPTPDPTPEPQSTPGGQSLTTAASSDSPTPVPNAADQERAAKLLQQVFKDDFVQAKQPAAKLALADKLLQQSQDARDDVASNYVLLREAADLAIEAADASAAERIIGILGSRFAIDPLEELSAALERTLAKPHAAGANKTIVEVALARIDEALDSDAYAIAQQLSETALAAARKAKDPPLLKQAVEANKLVLAAALQAAAKQKAEIALAKHPDDPEAHLVLGKYLCLAKDDWDAGLEHLAQGSDPTLKVLAAESISAAKAPSTLVELGDRWWSEAEKAKGKGKSALRAGAVHFYAAALPGLTGLEKTKVEKLLAQAEPAPARHSEKKPPTRTKKASAFEQMRRERETAQWALGLRARAKIVTFTGNVMSKPRPMFTVAELPDEPFLVFSLTLNKQPGVTDDELARHVAGLANLLELDVNFTPITDASLPILGKLTTLKLLFLTGTKITNAGTRPLAGLAQMERLALSETSLTDEGLGFLSNLHNLTLLHLNGAKVTDKVINYARAMPRLETLAIACPTIRGAGLRELRGLQNLQVVELNDSAIDDNALKELAELPNLRNVFLMNTKITDAGIAWLARCPQLDAVDLHGTKISAAAIQQLKAARPKLRVAF